jgi:hypothetical protein
VDSTDYRREIGFVKGDSDRKVGADVAQRSITSHPVNISQDTLRNPLLSPRPITRVCRGPVDIELGVVRVLNVVAVQDGGLSINPTVVEGQIQGGLVQGMIRTHRRLRVHTGLVVQTVNFNTYKIPTATAAPIEVILVRE